MAVHAFEVVLFTTRTGDSETKLEEYAEAGECEDTTWIGSECGRTISQLNLTDDPKEQ